MAIEIVPVSPAIGAEIRGVDLSKPVDEATFAQIARAWAEHLVLRFRAQRLTDELLVAFSRRFGTLDRSPPVEANNKNQQGYVPGLPEVLVISNVVVDGVPIGSLGAGEAEWHSDMSYNPLPPNASLLYALEVPPSGGDTGFCNMYKAYETLPADLKAICDTHQCIHDASYTSAGDLRRGQKPVTDVREAPGARHWLVRTHPVTGRDALYPGRRRNAWIVGMPVEESERVLDRLWAHATQPQFHWHHQWQVGDLLLWDNRCALHRRDEFDRNARRVMHRTQVQGAKPVFARAPREAVTA